MISWTSARLSEGRSSRRITSTLFMARSVGLLAKRGLMEWNSLHFAQKLVERRRWRQGLTHLGFDRVPTLFTQIHKVQDAALQVCQCSDALHLNGIHILQGMIQNPRGID